MESQSPKPRPRFSATATRPAETHVLNLLWREREISRSEVARRLGLSRSTVSGIVATLLHAGIVTEVGLAPSRGGRRPVVLRFADEACCILGVEMGAAHVSVFLGDLRGRRLAAGHVVHPVRSDPEGTRRLIVELCQQCLDQRPSGGHELLGIGVAVPSPVVPERPDGLSRAVMPQWQGRSQLLEALAPFGVPVLIDNDANLGALAEGWWSPDPKAADVLFLKVATGVGSGRFVAGTIARGATSQAGEIEHMVIDPQGAACACGRRGCLGTRVGRPALVAHATQLCARHPDSVLVGHELTIDALVDAARAGDPVGSRVAQSAADALGNAVAVAVNLVNPAEIVVGGGIARLGDLLVEPVREHVGGRRSTGEASGTVVRTSRFGRETVAVGAATLVLQRALDEPRWLQGAVAGSGRARTGT
jgi:predicted NBD/HSP70 family sugar kinase/DNA-binding CsgD family transcriptional regulator